jgi:hypothetical protein
MPAEFTLLLGEHTGEKQQQVIGLQAHQDQKQPHYKGHCGVRQQQAQAGAYGKELKWRTT